MISLIVPISVQAQSVTVDGIRYEVDLNKQIAFVCGSQDENISGDKILLSEVEYNDHSYHVTYLDDYCFDGCTLLNTVVIPETVVTIGEGAFWGCTALESINIPSSVTSLKNDAFHGCSSVISVIIPSTVTYMGRGCFSYCSGLTEVIISEGITSLPIACFAYCTSLPTVVIPSTMESIAQLCFAGCTGLESITCNAVTPPALVYGEYDEWWEELYGAYYDDWVWYEVNQSEVWLYVPEGSEDMYKAAGQWQDFRFPDNPGTAVTDIDGAVPMAKGADGGIVVSECCGKVFVFDTMGRVITTSQNGGTIPVTPGVYMVKTATTSHKVLVK